MNTVDVFCRVVDNLGDAGVCWRLCREFAQDKGLHVRLLIDDPDTLKRFVLPGSSDDALIQSGAITILKIGVDPLPPQPAELVIETFGCDVPWAYAEAMAHQTPTPHWINLEYLSAEDWVEGCHGLPSPHPTLPITRWFFFPGFSAKTGGLLKEPGLLDRRRSCQAESRTSRDILRTTLFTYDHDTLEDLLKAWNEGSRAIHCRVFQGAHRERVERWAKKTALRQLTLEYLPWLTQSQFDEVLFKSDFNVVRGEDSFVRAQWAARPFLWDIYPTEDGAHLVKMAAFLKRYREGVKEPLWGRMGALWQAWVRREGQEIRGAWEGLLPQLEDWTGLAENWATAGLPQEGLVDQLWRFIKAH